MDGDRPIDALLSEIASESVGPAGGTAAAIVGATGAACCEMVCIHTLADASNSPADGSASTGKLAETRDELRECRAGLLELATADERLVGELFGGEEFTPNDSDLKRATGVPLSIAERCMIVLDAATTVVELGAPRIVPDAITGARLSHGALAASVFTVRCNLTGIENQSFQSDVENRIAGVESAAADAVDEIDARTERILGSEP